MVSKPMIFGDRTAFFNALAEMGECADDGSVTRAVTSFADVSIEKYLLFDCVELNIFEIFPKKSLQVSFEFDDDYVEIEYGISGRFSIFQQGREDVLFKPNGLILSPRSGASGKIIFHSRQSCRNISFHATEGLIKDILGNSGYALWDEVMKNSEQPAKRKDWYSGMSAPPDIANNFIQVADCGYPKRVKRLFLESKFREILLRIIAYGHPSEICGDDESFAADQVKKIPGILMERSDALPTISKLARELSLNTTTMKRQFKKIFGTSIYAHHRNTLMERAAVMLSETKRPVIDIAIDAGYSSGENFCHAFKRYYGISPLQFRKGT